MTKETKAGIVVSCAFLGLAGTVLMHRYREGTEPTDTPPTRLAETRSRTKESAATNPSPKVEDTSTTAGELKPEASSTEPPVPPSPVPPTRMTTETVTGPAVVPFPPPT